MKSSWNPLAYKPGEVFKAIIAFLAPALVSLGAAVLEDSAGGTTITQAEWLQALIAAVVTSAGVFSASNKSENPPPNPEGGYGGILAILGVVLIVVGILGLFHVLGLSLAVSVVLVVVGLVLLVLGRSDL